MVEIVNREETHEDTLLPERDETPISCSQLLKDSTCGNLMGEILKFRGVDNMDIYNPTAPFEENGKTYLAARVESRENETDSQVMFFEKKEDGYWELVEDAPRFKMQDPAIKKIGDELVLSGVEVFEDENKTISWRTVFYKGRGINDLTEFSHGPMGMKDIRFVELPGKIGVFTRPWGGRWGRGKIGYMEIDSLDELNEEALQNAETIEGLFNKDEWGGVNEAHLLENGQIGALCHIARYDEEGNRHYYAASFCFDPKSRKVTRPLKIIATRSNFPPDGAKNPSLEDVFFCGGIYRNGQDGKNEHILYGGLSDVKCGCLKLEENPFE